MNRLTGLGSDVDNPQELTILSLCTGYGGIELGLSRALANPLRVVAVEIEAFALANLVAKAEAGKLAIEALWPDLKTFPAERFRGCFDFVIGGYPCQPFSCAGKRKWAEDPRHLWPHIAGIVQAIRPVWCFFENVSGHLTLGFAEVYRSLRTLGYTVEAGLFGVAWFRGNERLYSLATTNSMWELQQSRREPDKWRWVVHRMETSIREVSDRGRGGGAYGPRSRVDRLRLLGNGVVPQQAELAFRTLYKQIHRLKG